MDLREIRRQLLLARDVLKTKGAPIEGTAAGHILIALERLIEELNTALGETHKAAKK